MQSLYLVKYLHAKPLVLHVNRFSRTANERAKNAKRTAIFQHRLSFCQNFDNFLVQNKKILNIFFELAFRDFANSCTLTFYGRGIDKSSSKLQRVIIIIMMHIWIEN